MKMSDVMEIRVRPFGTTDVGMSREVNEDNFAVVDAGRIYIVADGIGGHNFGEVASGIKASSSIKKSSRLLATTPSMRCAHTLRLVRSVHRRDGKLQLLTHDHTYEVTEAQAREHPLKNIITSALGGDYPLI